MEQRYYLDYYYIWDGLMIKLELIERNDPNTDESISTKKKIHGNYLDISENIWWYVIDPINEKNNGLITVYRYFRTFTFIKGERKTSEKKTM